MCQDEARFGRINDPRRCWAPEGLRPEVSVQIVREYTYVFGAVSPHDGVLDTLVLPDVNAKPCRCSWPKWRSVIGRTPS